MAKTVTTSEGRLSPQLPPSHQTTLLARFPTPAFVILPRPPPPLPRPLGLRPLRLSPKPIQRPTSPLVLPLPLQHALRLRDVAALRPHLGVHLVPQRDVLRGRGLVGTGAGQQGRQLGAGALRVLDGLLDEAGLLGRRGAVDEGEARGLERVGLNLLLRLDEVVAALAVELDHVYYCVDAEYSGNYYTTTHIPPLVDKQQQ